MLRMAGELDCPAIRTPTALAIAHQSVAQREQNLPQANHLVKFAPDRSAFFVRPVPARFRRNGRRLYYDRADLSSFAPHIARRPSSARANVTSSVYSRSPPTGRPRASRVTTLSVRASC